MSHFGLFIILTGFFQVQSNPCLSMATCGDCIRTRFCAWCYQPNVDNETNAHRCNLETDKDFCRSGTLINPKGVLDVLEERPLTEAGDRVDNPVQLSPQRIKLSNMRIGQVVNVTLKFTQAEDYPVDLYFLMDLSNSMENDKDNLASLGKSLADTMRNLTRQFRLGFGSFVDKDAIPFVSRTGEVCLKDMKGKVICSTTYSFKHHLPLDKETDLFTDAVRKAQIVWTYDVPEGGFDALIQAMVCRKQIGWREVARHLIVFATDARSHMAGDGKMGGVIPPNDGLCNLDSAGQYTKPLMQDYPSLGQISQLAKDNSINLIFAVTSDQVGVYNKLVEYIDGATVGELAGDSSNIVNLIGEQYQKITSAVELRDTSPAGINVRYFTPCLSKYMQENNKCAGLKVGSRVDFTISIQVKECPANPKDRQLTFQISPVGMNEALVVEMNIVCGCPCEEKGNPGYVANAAECNNRGDLQCGVCKCGERYSGDTCKCEGNEVSTALDSRCKPNNATKQVCSDRGNCVCGKCECSLRKNPSELVTGEFCECDNFSCDRDPRTGKLCSGNGHCNCGKCLCEHGWQGKACDCASDDKCKAIGDVDVCSKGGQCVCGVCECFKMYSGTFCEHCPTCPSRCDEFEKCVRCRIDKTGPLKPEECEKNCAFEITKQSGDVKLEQSWARDCYYDDAERCQVHFIYGFGDKGEKQVRVGTVRRDRDCEKPVPVLAITFGLAALLILVGFLLLLLWKIMTYYYDKMEYARFLNEAKEAKWTADANPLYVETNTTFQNPAFGTKD